MTSVKVANFYGGIPIKNHREQLENDPPHIVVGTPGRIKQVGAWRPSALRSSDQTAHSALSHRADGHRCIACVR
jgi:hypothetical protein